MAPWSGCVPYLKEIILDASLSRDVWWRGPPCFGERRVAF